jgi:hypothetical protein
MITVFIVLNLYLLQVSELHVTQLLPPPRYSHGLSGVRLPDDGEGVVRKVIAAGCRKGKWRSVG